MKPFHIIVLAMFVGLAVAGIIVFATLRGFGTKNEIGTVVIWGTLPQSVMDPVLEEIRLARDDFRGIAYLEKDPRTYQADFVEALAAGRSPDLFLLPQERILENRDKVLRIPYASFSERDFKDRYVAAGEIFLFPASAGGEGAPAQEGGIMGLPFTVDPLLMYWNRSRFEAAGLARPPVGWEEFFALSQKLTEKNQTGTILKASAPLGEYANVPNAKETLAALIMQAGSPIVAFGADGLLHSALDTRDATLPLPSAEAALRFYTEFSDPARATYSWNRALPNAREMFVAGDLAVYFGFASELPAIRNSNPNLDFDVALLPQALDAKTKLTFGRVTALAIPRGAANVQGAFLAAAALSDAAPLSALSARTALPPVLRGLLVAPPSAAYQKIFYDSALIARGFLDPSPSRTGELFRAMIEDTTSGKLRLSEAVSDASEELEQILRGR